MARPVGAKNKPKGRRLSAALHRFYDADPRRLDELAEVLHRAAVRGEVAAFREIADRMFCTHRDDLAETADELRAALAAITNLARKH